MARFSKARLIEQLREKAECEQKSNGFENNNGTAQLRPVHCRQDLDEFINRAVAYGRWRQMQDIAADVESGHAGT